MALITDTSETSAKTRLQILQEQRREQRRRQRISEARRTANEASIASRNQKAELARVVRIDFLFPELKIDVMASPVLCKVTPITLLDDAQIARWNEIWRQLGLDEEE